MDQNYFLLCLYIDYTNTVIPSPFVERLFSSMNCFSVTEKKSTEFFIHPWVYFCFIPRIYLSILSWVLHFVNLAISAFNWNIWIIFIDCNSALIRFKPIIFQVVFYLSHLFFVLFLFFCLF